MNPVKDAMKKADIDYWRFDRNRDNHQRAQHIRRLFNAGHGEDHIATVVGLSPTHVKRIRTGWQTSNPPQPPTAQNLNKQRCDRLEATADMVLKLACRLRDDDPQIIADTLTALTREQLQEVTTIALAAIPTDMTKRQLFAWVTNLTHQENT